MNEKATSGLANNKQAIDLLEIWNIFWSRKILIIICAIIAVTLAFVKVTFFTADVYNANGILYVSNRNDDSMRTSTSVNSSDITTSRLMSTTYMEILTTRSFLTDVSDALDGKYSWKHIRSVMSISDVDGTALLKLNVNTNSPGSAVKIANAILDQAPYKLGEVFEGGEVKVVEHAELPPAPRSKNLSRTLIMALLAGIAIGCAIAFLLDYLDNKIHRSDDVVKKYNISILGEIYQ